MDTYILTPTSSTTLLLSVYAEIHSARRRNDVDPPVFLPAGFVMLLANLLFLSIAQGRKLTVRDTGLDQIIFGCLRAGIPRPRLYSAEPRSSQ